MDDDEDIIAKVMNNTEDNECENESDNDQERNISQAEERRSRNGLLIC